MVAITAMGRCEARQGKYARPHLWRPGVDPEKCSARGRNPDLKVAPKLAPGQHESPPCRHWCMPCLGLLGSV